MTSSGEYTVSETARAAGISRQAYYKWLNRRLSLREQQEREVLEEIKRIEKRHQDSVGYDKMVRLLNKEGRLSYRVGIKRVSRIMKINGIRADIQKRDPKHKDDVIAPSSTKFGVNIDVFNFFLEREMFKDGNDQT